MSKPVKGNTKLSPFPWDDPWRTFEDTDKLNAPVELPAVTVWCADNDEQSVYAQKHILCMSKDWKLCLSTCGRALHFVNHNKNTAEKHWDAIVRRKSPASVKMTGDSYLQHLSLIRFYKQCGTA